MFETIQIGEKNIYVVEAHHFVLLPWSIYRNELQVPPVLITFDHHTDTRGAFSGYCYRTGTRASELLRRMDFTNISSIQSAISYLKNDEHIDAAIKSGILSKAFVLSYSEPNDIPVSNEKDEYAKVITEKAWLRIVSNQNIEDIPLPVRPYTYPRPADNIFVVGNPYIEHTRTNFDQALESQFLSEMFQVFEQMDQQVFSNNVVRGPYILDIDLDYFHTVRSIEPNDSSIINTLIRGAGIITVAKESSFVNSCKIDSDLDSEQLLSKLLDLIEICLRT